jgi:DNA repair protein RAD16
MEDSCHETTIKKKTNAKPKAAAKKQKKKKDPNGPKRPMNAFLLYTNANRARIKAENPDVMYTAIPGIASAEFKSLNKKEKSKWDKSAVEDKARYQAKMEDYEPPEEEEVVVEENDSHNNNDANDTNNNNLPLADGNGNLNQPSWTLDYAPTGRATCRTCDIRIAKGEVRAGHQPLFRGKPGYVVYRHLHCVVFPLEVNCIQDVAGYNILTQGDCDKLVERIAASKLLIAEENEELCPDELVNDTTAQMSNVHMHPQPSGLIATLLPFQLEGYNWMVNQEVSTTMLPPIRGGILADEMGMGKTIQTIGTILQHRPLLQHAIPGMKHNPTCNDINERIHEETLWDEALKDWNTEMDLLNIPKKFRSGGKNGGARRRAGTLIICPVIALTQWRTEIEKFTELGTLTVCTYHGPDRESTTPRELLTKYDIVLTTYQVLEQDFRKMTSPNRVECPNCGSKFKIDKLPIHLKYFCGDSAERTEAQSRQRRNPDRDERGGGGGGGGGRNGGQRRRRGNDSGGGDTKKKGLDKSKDDSTKVTRLKKSSAKTKGANMKLSAAIATTKNVTPNVDSDDEKLNPRAGSPRRSAAVKAASQISRSAAEWMPKDGDDDNGPSSSDSDGEDESNNSESSSSDDDSELDRAREKQRQELEMCKSGKKSLTLSKKQPAALKSAKKGKTITKKKQQLAVKGKGKTMPKKKKFDDEFSDDSSYDSTDDENGDDSTSGDDAINEIDMAALVEKAMAGAKNSVLHSLCWWRIVLDEAHFIKSRSSQTANAAFSLIGIHRWALSGTPLQNRVGEFYSLVRFLRLDPMAYYYVRVNITTLSSTFLVIIFHLSHASNFFFNHSARQKDVIARVCIIG